MTGVLEIVFLLAAIQGAMLSFLLFLKKTNRHANRVLSVAIISLSLDLLYNYSFLTELYKTYPVIFGATFAFPFIYGPIFYIYTKIVTGVETQFRMKQLIHFIPFIIVHLYVSPYYLLSHQEKLLKINYYINTIQEDFIVIGFLKSLHGLVYTYFSLKLIKEFNNKLVHSFSNLEKKKLDWLRLLIVGSMIIWIIVALIFISDQIFVIEFGIPDSVIYSAISILIYAIGYGALNQPEVINLTSERIESEIKNEEPESVSVKYERSALSPEEREEISSRLLKLMEEKHVYTNREITLSQLAEELRITNHNLSEVINTTFNKNFYDFINYYRVEEFKRRIKNPDYNNYSLIAVAFESGFSSKSSFNSIFKKHTNTTPSEFRKQFAD